MVKIQVDNFSLKQISDSGQCFRMREESDGTYSVIAGGLYLSAKQCDNEIVLDCTKEEYESTWREYFDVNTDYALYIDSEDLKDEY